MDHVGGTRSRAAFTREHRRWEAGPCWLIRRANVWPASSALRRCLRGDSVTRPLRTTTLSLQYREAEATAWDKVAADARAVLDTMSRTILEPDVQARIDTFMAVPTEELEQRADVEIMSDQSGAEFATLHEIKYCRRKERLAKLRRRGEPLPPLIWPLRATLPTSQRTTLDDLYVDASVDLPGRDEQGRRLYSAVMAAQVQQSKKLQLEREIQPDMEADEGTESFAGSPWPG